MTNGPYKLKSWTPQSIDDWKRFAISPIRLGSAPTTPTPSRAAASSPRRIGTESAWSSPATSRSSRNSSAAHRLVRTPLSSVPATDSETRRAGMPLRRDRLGRARRYRRRCAARRRRQFPHRPDRSSAARPLHAVGAHGRQRQRDERRRASHAGRDSVPGDELPASVPHSSASNTSPRMIVAPPNLARTRSTACSACAARLPVVSTRSAGSACSASVRSPQLLDACR